ncbi:hypothetical protein [Pelagimonas varians]|uniref:Bacteriophage tail tape measure N-terminal domain-containing protein n=1 Tax=Pelagimonas varians TaxID=696760 RepID=A0A238KF18_9RHOB|nr:hypothetical protein [Pelagimonas varians]PYG32418.1 hypothetical protein C8N36_103167 [Pelagimonas varians]SMX41388.1 hypothetical protein PEV8663_02263 [Pelagimonas varians]
MLGKVKDLFFSIDGRDNTGPAFGSVNRRLRETDGLSAKVSERVGRAGKGMVAFGAAGTLGTAAVVAGFRDVVGLYDEQARVEAKVATAVQVTGGAAGYSADELFKMASGLQDVSRFGDEAILNGVTAQLLTFKEISGDVFEDAQKSVLDLATVLDGDLQSAAIMMGKALNDPIAGLSAMSRAGITFSDAQKDVIKDLAKTGDVAAAQRMILDEIASAYGGQAEAARQAGAGILDAWGNTWGDAKEVIGGVVVEILPPVIEMLEGITGWFQALEPEGQRNVVMMGALALAIPPVTMALGFMAIGISALTGPVGLVLGGISALAVAAGLLWPAADDATASIDKLTTALDEEKVALAALIGPTGTNINLSATAASQKLIEANSRYANIKAIAAEAQALAKAEFAKAESRIEFNVATSGMDFGPGDGADYFYSGPRSVADVIGPQAAEAQLLRARAEGQLERVEQEMAALSEMATTASGAVVDFGGSLDEINVPAAKLTEAIGGGGGGSSKGGGAAGTGLVGAVNELTGATEELAETKGWDTVKDNFKSLIRDGQSWETTWQNILGDAVDHLFDLAFSPAWDALFQNLSAMSGGGGAGGGMLGGLVSGAGNWVGNVLGLDTGGDVTVSGKGGMDRNLTVLRTSDAEQISVRRPGDSMGGGVTINMNIQTPDVQGFQSSKAQIAHQMRGAMGAAQRTA